GKQLDRARRRALTEAAGGSARVRAYCAEALGDSAEETGDGLGDGLGGTAGQDGDGGAAEEDSGASVTSTGADGEDRDDRAHGGTTRPTQDAGVLSDTGAGATSGATSGTGSRTGEDGDPDGGDRAGAGRSGRRADTGRPAGPDLATHPVPGSGGESAPVADVSPAPV
ncbi:hypothetical protein NGM37_23865, partial [Streptomyces sp. TRM76130]|nr:hypothetical protein [Streptomyces sp. TRM76130]